MLPERTRPAARRLAPRLAGAAITLLSLSLLACGVPISAVEMTATAENGGGVDPDLSALLAVSTSTSSRSGNLQTLQAQDVAAAVLTATPPPSGTVAAGAGTPSTTTTPSALATLDATGTASPSGTQTPSPTPSPPGNEGQDAVRIINEQRAGMGLRALTIDPNLAAAANAYAKAMAQGNFFSHSGADGSTPQSRTTASGYKGSFRGEALSAGQRTPAEAIDAWRTSPAHAAIIYNADAVNVGIGFFYEPGDIYGQYWVFLSGTP